jgi:SAM-dependent methyltransferase
VPLSGLSVLDAGCGAGAQAEWLLDQGADVVGIDLSPAMVEEARRRCAGRGRFLVADLAEPLPLEPHSLDGVTSSLTLHYVRELRVPLASFARALRPGGWVVMSLDHPFGLPLPSQRGGYFDTELVEESWRKGEVEVTQQHWRRPLSAVVDAVADTGFAINRILEPQPSAEALRRFPDELTKVVGSPWFIVYRLFLYGRTGTVAARAGRKPPSEAGRPWCEDRGRPPHTWAAGTGYVTSTSRPPSGRGQASVRRADDGVAGGGRRRPCLPRHWLPL